MPRQTCSRLALLLPLLLALSVLVVACGGETAQGTDTIEATVLVEPRSDDAHWFEDVSVPGGANAYELLEKAVDGELVAEWNAEFNSHFVQSILGTAPEGSEFWGIFVWNEDAGRWESMTTGADLYDVEDGDVIGWALIEYDPNNPQFPSAKP